MGKVFSGSALLAACSVAAPFFLPTPSFAQAVNAAALTECLVSNTTDEHIAAMKRLMIAALQDDIETLKAEATNYGNIIVGLAISNCKHHRFAAHRSCGQRGGGSLWAETWRKDHD